MYRIAPGRGAVHFANLLVDALSYEGSITATDLGFGPVSLVEGTPLGPFDPATGSVSLIRTPNGVDTNDASSDWNLGVPTPGQANP